MKWFDTDDEAEADSWARAMLGQKAPRQSRVVATAQVLVTREKEKESECEHTGE